MYQGLLCDVCQLRIPEATVEGELKVSRGEKNTVIKVFSLECCSLCLSGQSVAHKRVTVALLSKKKITKHVNPLCRV